MKIRNVIALGITATIIAVAGAVAVGRTTANSNALDRINARSEIENVMGRYVSNNSGADFADTALALFDLDNPEVTIKIAGGPTLVGQDAITDYWKQLQSIMEANDGALGQHMMTSPVIVLNADSESAVGQWQDTGVTLEGPGMDVPPMDHDHKYSAKREVARYDADFAKTASGWKIRRLAWTILWTYEREMIDEKSNWIADTSTTLPPAP